MKTFARFAVVAGMVMVLNAAATANLVTATFMDTTGDPGSVIALAGTSFSVQVQLSTDVSLVSGQLRVRDASSSGYFTLTGRSFFDPPWDQDPTWALPFTSPDALDLPDYKSQDIGTLANDVIAGTGTGTLDFMTVDVSVAPGAALGTYELNLADLVFGDTNYNQVPAMAGADYQVEVVVPAPGAWALGAIGLATVAWLRRRSSAVHHHPARW